MDLEQSELRANFDGREVTYGFGELDELVLAYATTIHKSQGSEYPAVVIPLTTQHYAMLARNLLYTGLTRGKRLVVLVGQRRALAIAVRNAAHRQRWSRLREWLRLVLLGPLDRHVSEPTSSNPNGYARRLLPTLPGHRRTMPPVPKAVVRQAVS